MKALATVSVCLVTGIAPGAVYYASPGGGGGGRSEESPALVSQAAGRLGPGDALILLDGAYTGPGAMLHVTPPVRGTAESPITIRARHDGQALIDGEGKHLPVRLYSTAYVTVRGINACRSRMTVVGVSKSDHCRLQRICAWDAGDDNTNIIGIHAGEHNLIEDCAGWGIARKTFSCSQNGNHTTFRRCWGRWEGCTNVGPKMVMTVSYDSHHTLVENCIGAWDGRKMPESHVIQNHGKPFTNWSSRPKEAVRLDNYGVDQPYGVFGIDTRDGPGVRLFGCIAYRTAGQRLVPVIANFFIARSAGSPAWMENCLSFVEPGAATARPYLLEYVDGRGISSVGGKENSLANCNLTGLLTAEDPAELVRDNGNLLHSPAGASIRFRYEDGKLTDEPLWPWPMNDRIRALTGVDVTKTVFELGGGRLPIPPPVTRPGRERRSRETRPASER